MKLLHQELMDTLTVTMGLEGHNIIPGRKYKLKYNGEFCHIAYTSGGTLSENEAIEAIDRYQWLMVGAINPDVGGRYILYSEFDINGFKQCAYLMITTDYPVDCIQEIKE